MFADISCNLITSLQAAGVEIINSISNISKFDISQYIKCCEILTKSVYSNNVNAYMQAVLPCLWQMQNIAENTDSVDVALLKNILNPCETPILQNRLYYVSLSDPNLHADVDGAAAIICRIGSTIHLTVHMWPTPRYNIKPHFNYGTAPSHNTELAFLDHFGIIKTSLHKGYEKQWQKLQVEVTNKFFACIRTVLKYHPRAKFHLTCCGLSRGGTLALSFALNISRLTVWPIDLVCFSSLRTATSSQMQEICNSSIRQCIRLYNRSDPCTHIPLKKLGYFHIDEYVINQKLQHVFPNHIGIDLETTVPERTKEYIRRFQMLPRIIFWHLAYYFPYKDQQCFLTHICSRI